MINLPPIALVQYEVESHSSSGAVKERNTQKALDAIRIAARKDAKIVCLQELFNAPYFCGSNRDDWQIFAENPSSSETISTFQELAASLKISICLPFLEQEGNQFFCTVFYID
ncbi:MAG: putative amidohydrolase [Oceanicoccus sp.]|jgi:predicted amidohydrolase